MKSWLFVVLIFAIAASPAHAQAVKVMGEQLLALKTLQQKVTDSYIIVTRNLTGIGSHADSEYHAHSRYLSSLYKVNPNILSPTTQQNEKDNDRPGPLPAESSGPRPDSSRPH